MNKGEIIIYRNSDGIPELQVQMVDETVWLTQLQMTELFGHDKSVTTRYIRNSTEEREVEQQAVVAKFETI